MANKPVILWFRRDLRLHDNPALNHAVETGRPIMPVFILDDHYDRPIGAASKWWLDKSLRALDAAEDLTADVWIEPTPLNFPLLSLSQSRTPS